LSDLKLTKWRRSCQQVFLVLLAVVLSGCSAQSLREWTLPDIKPPKPWVKPYQRQNLADPIMSFDRDPVANAYMDHVFQAREGARGAEGGSGGGCGCN